MTAQPHGVSFAGLHHRPGEPLLLPNAWDHASAAALAARGFPAIATSSLAVAAAVGLPDGAGVTREHTQRLAASLGAGPYFLSVDAEGGFSDDPQDVAELVRELWRAGAVGVNLEDGLGPAGRHAAKIAAVKAAVPGMFVNARTDTHWSGDGDETDTLRRLDAYQQAGADGVFVPGLTDPERITALVRRLEVPLNILYSTAGPTVPQLADLGVARVSLGSLPYRRALGAALDAVADIAGGRTPVGTTPSYDEVCTLARGVPASGPANSAG
ncbi:isocitrate lyase/PEP mutase family protein [Streptomyces sp. AF1A]|jgi:2-methylisocitrate lyase-like PEP mutase family enzyme|uniref:isocitrate lyase/PEP mutase family protein n=1 Tax=Streptomyces sp. AF1A TaxID=3394350 RepID=UPI0039BC3CB6